MFKTSHNSKTEEALSRFAQVRVLIADSDTRTADLVRRVLHSFGFRQMFIADNGEDALRMLRSKRADIIITESRLEGRDGVSMVKAIRSMKDDPHIRRDVPIIMLTAEAERYDVNRARDAGITEFLVKPFTAKTLSHRIIQVIDNPRVFVEAKGYVGPCRRRKAPIPDGKERRQAPEMKKFEDIDMSMFAGIAGVETKLKSFEAADIFAPNTALKASLGKVKAQDILNDKVIEAAQSTLQESESEFISWARDDIAKLEAAYAELKFRPGDPMAHHLLMSSAYAIKAQAGIFGYALGSQIGKALVEYMQLNPVMDANRLLVVRKHIDIINVIFSQKIKDSGQEIGRELLASLQELIKKMG